MQQFVKFLVGFFMLALPSGWALSPNACPDWQAETVTSNSSTWPPTCPVDLFPDKGSSYGLNWLGSFEHAPNRPDHLMSATIFDADRLIVASANRMIVIGRTPVNMVLPQLAEIKTDTKLLSNLDGATGSHYFHKFYNSAVYGNYVYATTRYDPIYAFQVTGTGTGTAIQKKWMAPKSRIFTENVQVVNGKLFVVHHADGLEVLSLANPSSPTTIASLGLTDSWGLAVRRDGNILVADGAAGVQWVQYDNTTNTLTRMGGETVGTSPGVVFDVAFVGINTALAAVSGGGLGIYYFNPTDPDPNHRLVRTGTLSLPGSCVDVEPMGANLAAVACRSWVHVVSLNSSTGSATVIASSKRQRRLGKPPWPDIASTNLASHVTVTGDKIYVTAWDHVDMYQLVSNVNIPDIRLSGHRVHFGSTAGSATVSVANGGSATLTITAVNQSISPHVFCSLDSMTIAPGAMATLTVSYDGLASIQDDLGCSIESNDVDDGAGAKSSLSMPIYAAMPTFVDPDGSPPEFRGNTLLRDYSTNTVTTSSFDLATYLDPRQTGDQVVHFAIWGSW
ncbi:MAG TPA: hypothetical protein VFA89_01930 [Terriglobales bacterium]|nr:hypothetical protein [Terriglobales bacterium]